MGIERFMFNSHCLYVGVRSKAYRCWSNDGKRQRKNRKNRANYLIFVCLPGIVWIVLVKEPEIDYNERILVLKEECFLIEVTRMNQAKITLNAELIESVEETPDTLITLTSGRKFLVKESRQEIKNLVILYKKEVFFAEK